eukprot:CAMPEP_0119547950 /NCGR_PEP_ID=MMETSP1352-20130426/1970_1 /TAXON_ID=265584 /ORGANISM="Stauroneis constricta, Strain CCMP1120" /LENGTH=415 /DNA_ID=CAMNT_0007593061 /DNA_START=241 /DNA_END=1488 /DNA_ORIENTATION=+
MQQRRTYQQSPYYGHQPQHMPSPSSAGSGGGGYYQQSHHDPYNTNPHAAAPVAVPQHVPIDPSTRNRKAKSAGCSAITVLFLMILTAASVAGAAYYYMTEIELPKYNTKLQKEEIEPITEYWSEKYAALENDHHKLQQSTMDVRRELREMDTALQQERRNGARALEEVQNQLAEARNNNPQQQSEQVVVHADTTHLDRRIQELEEMAVHLQHGIQEMSKHAAMEKFGPGPYRIEFELKFDPKVEETAGTDAKYFVVETAPLEMMPHSIYWFLEQVDRKLFQSNSFYINVPHVVQAGPRSKFANENSKSLMRRFKTSGFESLYFQEFNPEFHHHPWTIGFAGRPAGPEFYINLHENFEAHGPGGQGPGGDPCFAKVISGFDTIERLIKTPGKPEDPALMNSLVGIRSAVVLRKQHE